MVKDFALIHHIEIEFNDEFNVLTGETGAGKSIIIDAVSLLLGARASSKDIRYGSKKAMVEGVFRTEPDEAMDRFLEEMGCEPDEDRQVILYRELSANGKNTCRINDRTVTLNHFKKIGQMLVNIYGQHDFQAISNRDNHLMLLDSMGDQAFLKAKEAMTEAYEAFAHAMKLQKQLEAQIEERAERLEFLKFKLRELDELDLKPGEEEQLEQDLNVLDHYEQIVTITESAHQVLYGERDSIYSKLTETVDGLNSVREFDPSFGEMAENLQNMIYLAEDYGLTLSGYASKMDFDPQKRDQMNERKYVLDKAKRKYNHSIDELIEEIAKLKEEVEQLENIDVEIDTQKTICAKKRKEYELFAKEVREMRKQLAEVLTEGLLEQLKQLSMKDTRFEVRFAEKAPSAQGMDQVEFFMSANPGQPLRELSEIASGGEMSRIMLAFKTVLAQHEKIGTLIFDEIDTGIGGNIVVKVAEKLSDVSRHAQVICVTHSPQIAALADRHFQIRKTVTETETHTSVIPLEGEQEITELARMLGGEEEFQLQHARELKKAAKMHKENSANGINAES